MLLAECPQAVVVPGLLTRPPTCPPGGLKTPALPCFRAAAWRSPGTCAPRAADLGVAPLGDALPAEQVAAGRGRRVPALLQAQGAQRGPGHRSLLREAPAGGGGAGGGLSLQVLAEPPRALVPPAHLR